MSIIPVLTIISLACALNIQLTLLSGSKEKDIAVLADCSCQLAVFPVFNYSYSLKINGKEISSSVNVLIYIPTQNICSPALLQPNKQTIIKVQKISFGEATEITEAIFIEQTKRTTCSKDSGQKWLVYLVDKNEQNEYNYGIYLPKDALIITQCFAFIILIVLCNNIKYRRIRPIKFGYIFAIIYPIFLFASVYLSTFIPDSANYAYYVVMAFSFLFIFLFFTDIVSCCSDKLVVIYGVAFLLCSIILTLDMVILTDAWFINDLIAIFVAGTLIKFVVIKKMRTSIIPLAILWVFFIVRQFAVDLEIQNFENALQIRIVPLFLQVKTIFDDGQSGYPCSAYGTSKIITMGLILHYATRIDLFLSGHFYRIIISLMALICTSIELIIAIIIQDLPVLEYLGVITFIPLATGVMLLAAQKRGEWAEVWHGSFHDIAVDRKSIKKEERLLDQSEMNKNFEKLQINPSLITDSSY